MPATRKAGSRLHNASDPRVAEVWAALRRGVDIEGQPRIDLDRFIALCKKGGGVVAKAIRGDFVDVVGVHAVGGVAGTLLIGVFDTTDGLVAGAGPGQLGKQAIGAFAVAAYSLAMSWLLARAIDVTVGFRVARHHEIAGLDQVVHAETAYAYSTVEESRPVPPTGIAS
ncbi:hypothetical protein ABZ883_40380 [Streptomyces sp. NPDC046977]|uniref:hypothetical protein n=1 Tax=Streptomyces sp. NPDC046977 TaxID=3154703 RepID=UPI0033E94860